MAQSETYKVLAQANPSATTLTDTYTVPATTATIVSSLVVCNRSVATAFRCSIALAGAANDNKQYLFFDTPIGANETKTFTLGLTLATTDVFRVYATLATLSFSLYGCERSL